MEINGFKILSEISLMLEGKDTRGEDILENLAIDDIIYFEYFIIVHCNGL
jgi:hypothetical protein